MIDNNDQVNILNLIGVLTWYNVVTPYKNQTWFRLELWKYNLTLKLIACNTISTKQRILINYS